MYERLSKTDGADVYTSLCAYSVTTFTKDDFAARRELVSVYAQMKKSTVYLSGTHKGEGESRYFIADTEANLDKFSNYRKYYN